MRENKEKRKTVGDKEKTYACMREYRKKGPDRNRKNHNAHMKKYRATLGSIMSKTTICFK